jgi:hypothetical protein
VLLSRNQLPINSVPSYVDLTGKVTQIERFCFAFVRGAADARACCTRRPTQVIIITGANAGIGLETAIKLARLGKPRLILACRSLEKARARTVCAPCTHALPTPQRTPPPHPLCFARRARRRRSACALRPSQTRWRL